MDLVAGVKTVIVLTTHLTASGEPKLLERCTYPLTGRGVVDRVVTDLAVLAITPRGFTLVELAPGVSLAHLRQLTPAAVHEPEQHVESTAQMRATQESQVELSAAPGMHFE